MVHRKVYRERHRAIFKVLVEQYGRYEAYDMYSMWALREPVRCQICHATLESYDDWHETGYAYRKCSNGCWSHTEQSYVHVLETKGFYYRGIYDFKKILEFQKQISRNAEKSKRKRLLFQRKKRSQRGKSMNL